MNPSLNVSMTPQVARFSNLRPGPFLVAGFANVVLANPAFSALRIIGGGGSARG